MSSTVQKLLNLVEELQNTSTSVDDQGMHRVVFHTTPVVQFDSNRILLDSGGWKSATTKKRMNQASREHQLGFLVKQADDDWVVSFQGDVIPFTDGMELKRGHAG